MAIKIQGSTIIDDSRNIVDAGIGTFTTRIDVGAGGTIFSADANVSNDNILSVKNTSLNPAFDITGTGSVGIGITNPSKSLHVDGTGLLVASGSTTLFSVESFTPNSNVFEVYDRENSIILGVSTSSVGIGSTNIFTITPQVTQTAIGIGGSEILRLAKNTGNQNIFSVLDSGSSPLFTVTTTGDVGIGTTNPSQKLHVDGNFLVSDGNTTVLSATSGASSNVLTVTNQSSNPAFSVTGLGSVGIGTTQPDGVFEVRSGSNSILSVKDTALEAGANIFQILDFDADVVLGVTTIGIDVYDTFTVGVGTTNRVKFIPETTQLSVGIDTTNFLTLGTNTGSEDTFTIYDSTGGLTHFTATNAGNIGIGISNPTEKLHIEGGNVLVSNGSTTIFSVNQTGTNILSIQDAAGDSAFEVTSSGSVGIGLSNPTGIFEIEQSGNQLFQVSNTGSNSLSITDVSSNPAFDVTSSGKVGVGVTNPSANFEVVSAGSTVFSVNDTVGDYYLEIDTDKFVVTAAGDVGIGTTNPQSRLHIVGGLAFTDLNATGVSTLGTVKISSGIVTASSGIVTYYGDGSGLINLPSSGGGGVRGPDFNVGVTSILTYSLTGIGNTILQFPATAGKRYILRSINAANVATGNTDVNVIGAFVFDTPPISPYTVDKSYFAYNIPIPTGTSVELLRQPQIMNPSDKIEMRGTDIDRNGIDDAVEVYISYETQDDTNLFGVGAGGVGIGSTVLTDPIGIYTSSTNQSLIQSIRLANRTDISGFTVSVRVSGAGATTYWVDDLIIPKYASVEIMDNPKPVAANDTIQLIVDDSDAIDVQISGITIV